MEYQGSRVLRLKAHLLGDLKRANRALHTGTFLLHEAPKVQAHRGRDALIKHPSNVKEPELDLLFAQRRPRSREEEGPAAHRKDRDKEDAHIPDEIGTLGELLHTVQ